MSSSDTAPSPLRRRRASSVSFSSAPGSPSGGLNGSSSVVSTPKAGGNDPNVVLSPTGGSGRFRSASMVRMERKKFYQERIVEVDESPDSPRQSPKSPQEGFMGEGQKAPAIRCPSLGSVALALNYILWGEANGIAGTTAILNDPKLNGSSLGEKKAHTRDGDDSSTDGEASPLMTPEKGTLSPGKSLNSPLDDEKNKKPKKRSTNFPEVTLEQIFSTVKLPLHFATASQLSIHDLHEIMSQFIAKDPRFQECSVDVCTFDVQHNEGTTEAQESGTRQYACTLSDFRSELQLDSTSRSRVKLVCFDSAFTDMGLADIDDDEGGAGEDDDSMFSPSAMLCSFVSPNIKMEKKAASELAGGVVHKAVTALVSDLHPGTQMVELASPDFDNDQQEYGVHTSEVALHALHRAMAAKSPLTGRAQGFITLKKTSVTTPEAGSAATPQHQKIPDPPAQEEGDKVKLSGSHSSVSLPPALAVQTSMTADDLSPMDRTLRDAQPIHKPVPIFPFRPLALDNIDSGIASHLLAVGYGLHVLENGKKSPLEGEAASANFRMADIVRELKMPVERVWHSPLRVDQVFSYVDQYLEQTKSSYRVAMMPILRRRPRRGAPSSISVTQLAKMFEEVTKINAGGQKLQWSPGAGSQDDTQDGADEAPTEPQVVVLCCHDPNILFSTVNIDHYGPHWTVFNGYSDKSHATLLVDTVPSKYGRTNYVPLEDLHSAMVGHGFLVLAQENISIGALLPEVNDTVMQSYISERRSFSAHPLCKAAVQLQFPTRQQVPLTIAAVALTELGIPTTLGDLMAANPTDPSHLLASDMSMVDFARCINHYLQGRDDLVAQALFTSHSANRIASVGFQSVMTNALAAGHPFILNITRSMIRTAPPLAHSTVSDVGTPPGDFVLVQGFLGDDESQVLLVDSNPEQAHRCWTCSLIELFKASQDVCPFSRRHRGYIVIRKSVSLASIYRRKWNVNPFHIPLQHPFRPTIFPLATAMAMVCTSLGRPTSSEDIVYGAKSGSAAASKALGSPAASDLKLEEASDFSVLACGRRVVDVDEAVKTLSLFLSVTKQVDRTEAFESDRIKVQKVASIPAEALNEAGGPANVRYLVLYDVKQVHNAPHSYTGFAVFTGTVQSRPTAGGNRAIDGDDGDGDVPASPTKAEGDADALVFVDAEPSTWGPVWSVSGKLLETASCGILQIVCGGTAASKTPHRPKTS